MKAMMPSHGGSTQDEAVPEAILHPASRSLFSYWNRLRGQRSAPIRQEIELRSIAAILPWVGIIDGHSTPRRHCWRLAGTGIARLWGSGLTGTEVTAGWPDVYGGALVRALDGVCDRRQPFVARLKATSACGKMVGIEIFAAPVEAGGGAIQSVCTVVPFREPSWLGRIPLVDMELSTILAIWTDPLPDEMAGVHSRGPGSAQFKLIKGGRSD
jgi:hypothetical protein